MAKISRNALKGLVKECLVEILAEGLLAEEKPASSKKALRESTSSKKRRRSTPSSRRPALDQIRMGEPEPQFNTVMPEVKDPIMASIFADTAANTFQQQVLAEQKNSNSQRIAHGDAATKAMAQNDPMDIFDGANNWAKLAFDK
jgi:hypothetical protein